METKPFPALQEWLERIQAREGVQRGVNVPEKFEMKVCFLSLTSDAGSRWRVCRLLGQWRGRLTILWYRRR